MFEIVILSIYSLLVWLLSCDTSVFQADKQIASGEIVIGGVN